MNNETNELIRFSEEIDMIMGMEWVTEWFKQLTFRQVRGNSVKVVTSIHVHTHKIIIEVIGRYKQMITVLMTKSVK